MKTKKGLFISIILLITVSSWAQKVQSKISIQIPSIQEEATSIWKTINDIEFYEKLGYRISLPDNDLIDSLIIKSKNGRFGNADFLSIYGLLESGVYKKSDYQMALKNVQQEEALINNLIQELDSLRNSWDWEFKLFDNYPVVFTLYGTGGSYDPKNGAVTLFTTTNGRFKNYERPSNTIIHEIVHIGMEESIVQKYKLSHPLKERIVDKIVFLNFKEFLPEYRIQNMGEMQIDEDLREKTDILNLSRILDSYLEK